VPFAARGRYLVDGERTVKLPDREGTTVRHDIQPYQPQPLDAYSDVPEPPERQDSGAGLLRYVEVLKRRWRTILALWPLVLVPAVISVWLLVKVKYTATAQIEVRPSVGYVLYPTEDKSVASFDGMLTTQAELMKSQKVLRAALADPKLRRVPVALLNVPDPLAALRKVVTASSIRGSYIVQLNVQHEKPEEAKVIAGAVLAAYLANSGAAEEDQRNNTLERVRAERDRLEQEKKAKTAEINEAARVYGANDAKMFDLLRQSIEKYSEKTNEAYQQAKANVREIEGQLNRARGGVLPDAAPVQSPSQMRDAIENDVMVRTLRQQYEREAEHLAKLKQLGLTDQAKQVVDARERIEQLKSELSKERTRAAADIEKDREEMAKGMASGVIKRLETQLKSAIELRDGFEKDVKTASDTGLELGRTSMKIQDLQRQLDSLDMQFGRADQRVQELETEKNRAPRIVVASEPEILPDGVKDNRVKFTAAALFGSLFFALAVAFLKDFLDPHVHGPDQVESGLGLRLLGLVPSLTDLREGRITEGEFAESYRLVRACLAVAGPNGFSPKSILATSAQACEGKTSLAVSLAASLAEAGNHVLLIDGDIQGPQIERALNLTSTRTLKDVLAGEATLDDAIVHSSMAHLDVLTARLNSNTARGVLNPRSALRLVREAVSSYEYVIVDSPPILGAADAVVWAEAVDGVILSSFVGQSNSNAMRMACHRLRGVGARILGAVMCNLSIRGGYYSFSTSSASVRSDHPGRGDDGRRTPPHVQLPVVEIYPSEANSDST
jgi:polysaccharide biosynthesis transport protein